MSGLVCHMDTLFLNNLSNGLCSFHPGAIVLGGQALHQYVHQTLCVVQAPYLLHKLPMQLTDAILHQQCKLFARICDHTPAVTDVDAVWQVSKRVSTGNGL